MSDPERFVNYRLPAPSPAMGPGSLGVVLDRAVWHLAQARGELGVVLDPVNAGEAVDSMRPALVALANSVSGEIEAVTTVRLVLARRLREAANPPEP